MSSAFVCILHRDGAEVEPRDLQRLAEALAGYGEETAAVCRGPFGVAVRRPQGPGAERRHGPLIQGPSGGLTALAGRIDAFAGTGSGSAGVGSAGIGSTGVGSAGMGTAGLAGYASEADGYAGAGPAADGLAGGTVLAGRPAPRGDKATPLERLSILGAGAQREALAAACGSFALLTVEDAGGGARVRIARDQLGDVAVYYFLDRRRLIAATDPAAILRHPEGPGDLDEASITGFLGFRSGWSERSFFRHVRMLPPAHLLEVTAREAGVEPFWRMRRLPDAEERTVEEAAGELLGHLRRSVGDQTAGLAPGEVALSLSGGLDSTAVAAVAPRGIRAFSWCFEATPEADERGRIEAVSRHLGLPLTWVRGDGLHPLGAGFAERFVQPGSPVVNPFAALKHRLYETARDAGCRRVMVGDGGDALYAAREHWLRDLLADRRPGALGSLAATVRRAARGDRFARLALRRLLPEAPRRALRREPPWLTAEARAALPAAVLSPTLPPGPWGERYELAAGARNAEIESEERRLAGRCGVERANPFWSWPLLEAAIQLPAYRYHRDGRDKLLSRAALRGRLPDEVVEGGRSGSLGPFFLRGIELARDELRETVFRNPRSDWQRWVRRGWVERHLDDTRSIAFGHTILWRLISYELWWRRIGSA